MSHVDKKLFFSRHPELGVLMCTKCYKSYGRGGWTKDGEGNDEYCRCELFFSPVYNKSLGGNKC